MANEIKTSLTLDVSNGSLEVSKKSGRLLADMTGPAYSGGVQNIGTTHEQLTVDAGVGTAGVAWFRNLDDTNFVEIGTDVSASFEAFAKLKPGEVGMIRLATTAVYAKADTAAVDLEYLIFED